MTGGGRGGGSGGAEALSAVGAGGQAAVSPTSASPHGTGSGSALLEAKMRLRF